MAHYAFLDELNRVTEVIVGIDENELIEGLDPETWYGNLRGQICKRTSYNAATNGYRKQYAGIGFTFDDVRDEFVAPQPYPSWTLDEDNDWQPPIPKPLIEEPSWWDEENLEWVVISKPLTGGPYEWSEEDLEWVAI